MKVSLCPKNILDLLDEIGILGYKPTDSRIYPNTKRVNLRVIYFLMKDI